MPFVYSNTIFGILLHMWPVLGGPKIEKYNFGNIQNGWQWPKGSLKEKVQKTKKYILNELHLKYAKLFDLRSKSGLLEPKSWYSGFRLQGF